MMSLTARLLDVALCESKQRVEALSQAIAAISAMGTEIQQLVADLDDLGPGADPTMLNYGLLQEVRGLKQEVSRSLVAMQFHDQFVQRVEHVRDALLDIGAFLGVPEGVRDEMREQALYATLRAHYTMDDERRLFNMVVNGSPGSGDGSAAPGQGSALHSGVELF